jgi:ABC-type sulfate/molybdate transport systems ATPase subunit
VSVIQNLIRSYGDFKIEIPRWEIADSGITALKGPSGSGKTSVIRLLLGLEPCPGLSWVMAGVDIAKLPVDQRRLGVVFQTYEIFGHMSARENLKFAARARKIDTVLADKKIEALIEKLQLSHFIDRQAQLLSGGEKQRVALARALIGEPRFLFLDEPFSALDADLRESARQLVKDIIAETRTPTLLVSHDDADIRALAKDTIFIDHGKLK